MFSSFRGASALVDAAPLLDSLIVGDTIQIGVTVWSVQAVSKVLTYYDVTVLPAAQAAVSGTQAVTFARL